MSNTKKDSMNGLATEHTVRYVSPFDFALFFLYSAVVAVLEMLSVNSQRTSLQYRVGKRFYCVLDDWGDYLFYQPFEKLLNH